MTTEPFKRGDSLTAPEFRRNLNAIAAIAGGMRQPAFGSPTYGPIKLKLFEVPYGATWAADTTDSITDDVTSALCNEVYLDQQTNTYDENTDREYRVYNSSLSTEPTVGSRFFAFLNPQSGRYELLAGGGESSCDFIQFTIDTVSEDCLSAVVTINYVPCGCGEVPEELNNQVTVYDVDCKFEGIARADIPGLQGTAKYMESRASGECLWIITNLCCDNLSCA